MRLGEERHGIRIPIRDACQLRYTRVWRHVSHTLKFVSSSRETVANWYGGELEHKRRIHTPNGVGFVAPYTHVCDHEKPYSTFGSKEGQKKCEKVQAARDWTSPSCLSCGVICPNQCKK